jgi:hypothetical protein
MVEGLIYLEETSMLPADCRVEMPNVESSGGWDTCTDPVALPYLGLLAKVHESSIHRRGVNHRFQVLTVPHLVFLTATRGIRCLL